jgi:hypothetical protein
MARTIEVCNFCFSAVDSRCPLCLVKHTKRCSMVYFHRLRPWVQNAVANYRDELDGRRYKVVNLYRLPRWRKALRWSE